MKYFYGKYRGKVENNVDPLQLGRLQVSCPLVLGEGRMSWAMPCVPYAGPKVGLFVLPPKDANVWVEFEGGNIDSPIWTGCFWDKGQVPAKRAVPEMKVLKTDGIELTLDDTRGAGGLTVKVGAPAVSVPATLVINSKGVQLTTQGAKVRVTPAKIEISLAPGTISVSPSAVEVKHGGASVNLQTLKISLNKGAFEVT
jgi:hypothetical protein